MKQIILVLIFLSSSISLQAQLYIGNDIERINYHISDEYIGSHTYEKVTIGGINPTAFFLSRNHIAFVRFTKKVAQADLVQSDNYQGANYLDIQNFELDIEYFRRVTSFSKNLDGFIGLVYNGHFTYLERTFWTQFYNNEKSSHEMAAVSFSVNALLKYQREEHTFHYKAGVGFINFGSRPDENWNNLNLELMPIGNYFRIHHSLIAFLKISDRFLLKPEYRLRYYTFKEPERLKLLKQGLFLGAYVRLW